MRGIEGCFTLEVEDLITLPGGHPPREFIEVFGDGCITAENSFQTARRFDSDPNHRACERSNDALRRTNPFQNEKVMARYGDTLSWLIIEPIPPAISTPFPKRYGMQDLILERRTQSRSQGVIPTSIEVIHVNDRCSIKPPSKVCRHRALSSACWPIDRDDSNRTGDRGCTSCLSSNESQRLFKRQLMDGVHGDTNASYREERSP